MTDTTPTPPSFEMQDAIVTSTFNVLDRLPYGRAEDDVRQAAFFDYYVNAPTDPTDRQVAEWHGGFDETLHHLIRDRVLAQREIGGKVRILTRDYARNYDRESDR